MKVRETLTRRNRARLSPETTHAACAALVDALGLSQEHADELRGIGLPDPRRRGYATLPPSDGVRADALGAVASAVGSENLCRVPGVDVDDDGRATLAESVGVLIPVRNQDGTIAALQIAEEVLVRDIRWLGGHHDDDGEVRPVHIPEGTPCAPEEIRVVADPVDADVLTATTNTHTIAVPGHCAWPAAGRIARDLGVKWVRLAPTLRTLKRGPRLKALAGLSEELALSGIKILLERWPANLGGGHDDVIREWAPAPEKTHEGEAAWTEILRTLGEANVPMSPELLTCAVATRFADAAIAKAEACASETLNLAAQLDANGRHFQLLVDTLKAAKVGVHPFKAAVKERRKKAQVERNARCREQMLTSDDPRVRIAAQLQRTDNGTPRPNAHNLTLIATSDPLLEDRLGYNELTEAATKVTPIEWPDTTQSSRAETGEWTDEDTTRLAAFIAHRYDLDASTARVHEAVEVAARRRSFHPFRDFLDGLVWDGTPRLDCWLVTYAGAEDNAYVRGVGRRWLIAAVARTYSPGCKVDNLLILEGPQGNRKSWLLRALAGDEYFFDGDLPLGTKDVALNLRGVVIVEIAELSSLKRAEQNAAKAFLTRQSDDLRPPYGRRTRKFLRRAVFAGTTNDKFYLKDKTGNRRYWSVSTGTIRSEAIQHDRDQLWAEAVALFKEGAPWWVDDDEFLELCQSEQEQRQHEDPWREKVRDWLAYEDRDGEAEKGITLARLLSAALELEPAQQTQAVGMRLADLLHTDDWTHKRVSVDGKRRWRWFPPETGPFLDDGEGGVGDAQPDLPYLNSPKRSGDEVISDGKKENESPPSPDAESRAGRPSLPRFRSVEEVEDYLTKRDVALQLKGDRVVALGRKRGSLADLHRTLVCRWQTELLDLLGRRGTKT